MTRSVQLAVKHVLDRALSAILLALLTPLMLVLSAAIMLESGRPALFVQTRVGRNGRLFRAYKFRTMVQGASQQGLGTTVAIRDDRIFSTHLEPRRAASVAQCVEGGNESGRAETYARLSSGPVHAIPATETGNETRHYRMVAG